MVLQVWKDLFIIKSTEISQKEIRNLLNILIATETNFLRLLRTTRTLETMSKNSEAFSQEVIPKMSLL